MTMHVAAPAPIKNAGNRRCARCGFQLWASFATLRVSTVGLYDDSRFPGRCLLAMHDHYTDLLDIPDGVISDYLKDLRDVRSAIQNVTGAARVNYAVLGNAEPHVHWHVVPRFPEHEALPNRSPWSDPRPITRLKARQKTQLLNDLEACLQ